MPDQTAFIGQNGAGVTIRDGALVISGSGGGAAPIPIIPKKGTAAFTRVQPNTTATALAANANRIAAVFENVGSSNIYLVPSSGGAASATNGIKIEAGKSFVDLVTVGQWNCFSDNGAGDLRVIEVS